MTDETDELTTVEQIAGWLSIYHHRETWELIRMLGKGWPDATAAEIAQAWELMGENAMKRFEKDVESYKKRSVFGRRKDDHPRKTNF